MDANIVDLIKTSVVIDKDMVKKWQSVKGILIKNAIQTEIDVKASTAEAYKFDLEGLFINVIKFFFQIAVTYHYITFVPV